MTVRSATAADRAAVIDLIVAEQVRPERHIPYLGDQRDAIVAELDALDTPWTGHLHVALDGETVVGAAYADVDGELGRAWIHGPWVSGDDDRWSEWAGPLVDAVTAALPDGLGDLELSGDARNVRLSALAAERGHEPSEINWLYTLTLDRAAEWDDAPSAPAVRAAAAEDAAAMTPLHDAEFPDTYLPVDRLLAEAAVGERLAIVATDPEDAFLGYASGEVQPDGAGYIDYLAVDPSRRGHGAGRALVIELVRQLAPNVTTGAIHLTVQDHRAPARALYERLGFGVEFGLVGYRRR